MDTITTVLLILSVFIAAGLAFFQYLYKAKNRSKLNLFLAFLRFLSFLGIFVLLINPSIIKNSFEVEKTPLVVVMDNSTSIPFLKSNVEAQKVYQKIVSNSVIKEKFYIQSYQFAEHLKLSKSFNFKGKQTNLDAVAKRLKQIYRNKSFPTIIITDGNQTIGTDYVYSFDTANKVYPIVLGDTAKVFDLKINQINANKYTFYKNKFPVEAFVTYSGDQKIEANFKIYHNKSVIAHQNISFSPSNKTAVIQLLLPANAIGLQLFQSTISSSKKEKNYFNNTKNFAVEVMGQMTDIALISALNHPDIGALKRAIESNSQRKVVVFKPNAINELKKYNIVILYQPNSSFKSVFEEVKLAGINSFIITGTSTDFGLLNQQQNELQFKMGSQSEDYFAGFNSQFNLFALDDIGFEFFPPLQNSFGTTIINGNTSVLLSSKIKGITTQSPLLAFTENQGKRTVYLLGENSWKWRAKSYIDNQSFEKYDVFIDKIIQFLASNSRKKSLVVEHEQFYNSGDNIVISAQYFNKNQEFDEKARLNITLLNTQTKAVTNYDLLKGSNSYKVNLDGIPAGKYKFTVTELNSKERYSGYFEILNFDVEKQFTNPDFEKLNQLANQTQGKLYMPAQIDTLLHQLVEEESYKSVQKNVMVRTSLIDWFWLLVIISILLASEWFVRKYNGLL